MVYILIVTRRGKALLALAIWLPACGSILGVEALDVRDTTVDAGADAGTPPETDDSGPPLTPMDGGDAAPPDAVLPPAGTYTYDVVSGSHDSLKLNGGTISDLGYSAPTVVIAQPNPTCFTQTLTLRDNYVETMSTFCIDGPTLVQKDDRRTQTFQIGSADTTSTCAGLPAGDVYFSTQPSNPGTWPHDCMGNNSAQKSGSSDSSGFEQAGNYVYVETVPVPISGINVPTYHFHVDLVVTKSQSGTNSADWYLSTRNGLLVRLVRTIDITYGSQFGPVAYHENVDMTLKAPPP